MTNHRPTAVWLFAGGPMQKRAAEAIKRRGHALILTDGNPNCVCAPLADVFVPLNTFDISGNLTRASELKEEYDIRAVFTAGADCHESVAILAKYLGCHGVDPSISHRCRFKYETRELLATAGISQPLMRTAKTYEEAKKALLEVGVPAALKATDSSGSRGFTRIDTYEDLSEEAFSLAKGFGTSGKIIIEELLIPVDSEIAEQSVETLWYDGEMRWLNWVDRLFRKDFIYVTEPWTTESSPYRNMSWAVELAHTNPAVHSESVREEVEKMIRQAGLALGMGNQKGGHFLKADIMLTTKGPIILELTLRLSGGWDSAYSTPARGADFIEGMLSLALGEPLTEELVQRYFTFAPTPAFSAVLARVDDGAVDCIGRDFAGGTGNSRDEAIQQAFAALSQGSFLT